MSNRPAVWWYLYVRRYSLLSRSYEFVHYRTLTNDIYHVIGYMYCSSVVEIKRVDYCRVPDGEDMTGVPIYVYK